MSKHNTDLIMCAKLPGVAIGRVGNRHDGQCVGWGCDSFVKKYEGSGQGGKIEVKCIGKCE